MVLAELDSLVHEQLAYIDDAKCHSNISSLRRVGCVPLRPNPTK